MIRMTAQLLKVLNSETEPGQISLAFCFAMIAGFTPFMSLHNLIVLFLVLIIRVNLSAFLLGLAVFKAVAFALDPIFHRIGAGVLTLPALEPLWTSLYNSTIWRIEHFNNSIVMGSLIASLVLFVPLYVLSNRLIRQYRQHVLAYVRRLKIVQALTASRWYQTYQSLSSLH
ncbi:MAG TPA: TIGR03546 family protein [Nitrospirales bacterium]|nr:TIGR03546 family protein [Nitrospirales bacterium]